MANYQQAQPFSFFGYPQTYSGGFTANPSTYTGGFTPYQRLVTPQPALPVEEIPTAPTTGGGGGGRESSEPRYVPVSPLATPESGSLPFQVLDAYGQTVVLPGAVLAKAISKNMLPGELEQAGINSAQALEAAKEGYSSGLLFGAPPSDVSTFAGGGYGVPGAMTTPTGAGIPANPMSVDPAQAAQAIAVRDVLAAQAQADAQAQAAREAISRADAQAQAQAQAAAQAAREQAGREAARQAEANAAAAAAAQAAAQNYSNEGRNYGGGGGGYGGGGGGGVATGGNNGDASGGGDRGTRGGFAQGGHVSMMHLGGPNPEGPDDGYAALKDGEFVINDKAVKKYGIELMNLINSSKISKGKLRGLLEM
jgi:hypothetical protein